MSAAIKMRSDFSGDELRRLASAAHDGEQTRRLMALAAIADGKNRTEAATIGLMDRQTLRDWVIRFNEHGPDGLINKKTPGRPSKLTAEQKRQLAGIVEEGPANLVPGLIRWRCIDLVPVVKKRFGVECHAGTINRILRELGFSHISPRPQHPKQDEQVIEEYKKLQRSPD
jgi:transposase